MSINTKYIGINEMSIKFNKDKRTIWSWVKSGILPQPLKFGSRTRLWDEVAVDFYILSKNPSVADQLDGKVLEVRRQLKNLKKLAKLKKEIIQLEM